MFFNNIIFKYLCIQKRVFKDRLYGDDLNLNQEKPKKIVFQKITTFIAI